MKVIIFFLYATLAMVLCYDDKFDKVDVDKILADDTQFDGYLKCLLDKGPCHLEYSEEYRKLLPEVIATACAKCTPIQKTGVRKTVKAITERRPEEFKEFIDKFDPTHEHEKGFTAFVLGTD